MSPLSNSRKLDGKGSQNVQFGEPFSLNFPDVLEPSASGNE